MQIIFIRHGRTKGNLEQRYIGRTDEGLCPEGRAELQAIKEEYPKLDKLAVSPMKRCMETAHIIYPDLEPVICDELKECDFGQFENRNYLEMKDDPEYQRWIDSNGSLPFPQGESKEEFSARCVQKFDYLIGRSIEQGIRRLGFIVHGGTIMSILEYYSDPHRDYYNWQVGNCCGYLSEINEKLWMDQQKKLRVIGKLGDRICYHYMH